MIYSRVTLFSTGQAVKNKAFHILEVTLLILKWFDVIEEIFNHQIWKTGFVTRHVFLPSCANTD